MTTHRPTWFGRMATGAFVLAALTISLHAHASPVEVFGASARGAAMAGAVSADGHNADAVHYNPGSLARVEPGLNVSFSLMHDNTQILLKDRPDGYDIPNLGGVGPAVPTDRELNPRGDTDGLGNMLLMNVGFVASPGIERLRVGVMASVPVVNGAGQPTWFADERERLFSNQLRYELLGERLRRFDLQFGIAYQMTNRISVGVGASYLPKIRTHNNVYLPDAAEQQHVDIAVNAEQGASIGFRAGIHYEVAEWLKLGASWRSSLAMSVAGSNELRIRGFEEDPDTWPLNQEIDLMPFFSPTEVTAAASLHFGRWVINPEASYVRWSSYRDRQNQPGHFSDRINPRVGVEYNYSEDMRIRTGLALAVSPVPDQTGRTNHVDNTRITAGFGAEHDVTIFGTDVMISWYGQFHQLLSRDTDKILSSEVPACEPGVRELCDELPRDTINPRTRQPLAEAQGAQIGNPGFPGFVSGGWIAAAGVQLSWNF